MNPMQQRRLRASSRRGDPGPWSEVLIQQQQQARKPLIGSSPQIDDPRRPQRLRFRAPDPGKPMWCLVEPQPSPSENSEEQQQQWWQDPSSSSKGKGPEGSQGSESSVVTDDEAIAVQSLLALELLSSSIHDSAASKVTRKKKQKTKKIDIVTRRVFVGGLGITILQRRVEPRRAAPRSGELSHPGLEQDRAGDSEPRSRSKRKRAGQMPPKFHDSVLLIKQQKQPKRKKSRRV